MQFPSSRLGKRVKCNSIRSVCGRKDGDVDETKAEGNTAKWKVFSGKIQGDILFGSRRKGAILLPGHGARSIGFTFCYSTDAVPLRDGPEGYVLPLHSSV